MRIERLDLAIVLANLAMWAAVPIVARDANTSLFMAVTAATCVWRPFTAGFMVGLMETSWEEAKFRDLLLTPGRIVMLALLFRAAVLMFSGRRVLQPRASRVLFVGLIFYVVATVAVSLAVRNPVPAYAAVAYGASAIGLVALYSTPAGRENALTALWFGMLPAIVYYGFAFTGIAAPIESTQVNDLAVTVATGRMNVNANAAALALASILSLYVATTTAGLARVAALVSAGTGVLFVVITGSRGGLIGLGVGVFAYLMLLASRRFSLRQLGRSALAAVVLAGVTMATARLMPELTFFATLNSTLERLFTEADQDAAESFRKRQWLGAIDHIAAAPLRPDYKAYRDEYILMSHNTLLEVGLQGGVIAIAGFVIVLVTGAWSISLVWRRRKDPWAAAILAIMVARGVTMMATAMPGDKMLLALVILAVCGRAAWPAEKIPAR